MLSLKYKNINYVMTQILKLSCVSFSYVSISYVLALEFIPHFSQNKGDIKYIKFEILQIVSSSEDVKFF